MKTERAQVWSIDGMSCVNCATGIENRLAELDIVNASVDLSSAELYVFDQLDETRRRELESELSRLGFALSYHESESTADRTPDSRSLQSKQLMLGLCVAFTLPLVLSMIPGLPGLRQPPLQFALALPVQLIGMFHFGRRALSALRTSVFGMDWLILIGSTAAFGYSTYGWLRHLGGEYLFFETAAVVITVVLAGRQLEARALRRTAAAMDRLVNLRPATAQKIGANTDEIEVISTNRLAAGDRLKLRGGERIPVDGLIDAGEGLFDESTLTGESHPVYKSLNDRVFAGSLLIDGLVVLRATSEVKSDSLSQIVELVRRAKQSKPRLHLVADRVAALFVPLVLVLSGATFMVNFLVVQLPASDALLRAVAVLVVACPCAMGLATPAAVYVGIGLLVRRGFLPRGGDVLERLAQIRHVTFDKTGTLTTGRFSILRAASSLPDAAFKSIVRSLEQHSIHPIARSLCEQLADYPPIALSGWREVKGRGVMAHDERGNSYAFGSYELVRHLVPNDEHDAYLIKNQQCVGWLDLGDELRPGVHQGILKLQTAGVSTSILSGDRRRKVEQVAAAVGVDGFSAELLPHEKHQQLVELQRTYATVALVGDGVNDAAALAQADVGIAMTSAADLAVHAADLLMLGAELANLARAFEISRSTMRTIRQNLFWAFFYNALMIPLAACGLLSPMVAAVAMIVSSLFVVGNSLRLNWQFSADES